MTLAVMALEIDGSGSTTSDLPGSISAEQTSPKTIADALSLLESLRPQILELMQGAEDLQVPLTGLDIMNNDKNAAYVVWTGPGSRRDESPLWSVSCTCPHWLKLRRVELRPLQ
jgi:hypothetical protein